MNICRVIHINFLNKNLKNVNAITANVLRDFCSVVDGNEATATKGGFARAFDKYTAPAVPEMKEQQTFAALLRNSKFIDMGDPDGKIVMGKIFHVVEDDLYIDFGWKFHCVCSRPLKNGSDYIRGSRVRLRVRDLELSTKFLGSSKDLTILEADCQLLGLVGMRTKKQ